MAKTILTAVSPKDKVDLLLRRLETLVGPGDRVVFLSAYRCGILNQLVGEVSLMQTGLEAPVICEQHRRRLLWEEQKARLEQAIAVPVRRALGHIVAEVEVDLYSGRLNRLLKRYRKSGDLLVVLPANSSSFRRTNFIPVSLHNWCAWPSAVLNRR